MVVRRLRKALLVIALAPALASCAGFGGYVADHWPHWAGGMPEGVPPRPGAPGYDEFIAHQQQQHGQDASAAKPAASAPPGTTATAAATPAPAMRSAPQPSAPVAAARPVVEAPGDDDPSVVKGGGLY